MTRAYIYTLEFNFTKGQQDYMYSFLTEDEKEDLIGKRDRVFITSLLGKFLIKYHLIHDFHFLLSYTAMKKTENGKPYLIKNDAWISISHKSNNIAICISDEGEIGIDIEVIESINLSEFTSVFDIKEKEYIYRPKLHSQKIEHFYHLWTLKESYTKLTGDGLLKIPYTQITDNLPKILDTIHTIHSYTKKKESMMISICSTQLIEQDAVSFCTELPIGNLQNS